MSWARAVLSLAVVAWVGVLSGCASFNNTLPAPPQGQPLKVSFNADEASGWSDLPTGVYRVPDSQVIVSGHQKGGAAGILFGVLGVAVQSAINASAGADATKDAGEALRIHLTAPGQAIVDELVASGRFGSTYTLDAGAPGARLAVSGAVALTFVNDTDARPYVVLKAALSDKPGAAPAWSTRYIAATGPARPLLGDGSWTENRGAALKSSVDDSLRLAVATMLSDVAKPGPRDDKQLTLVQGGFPYVKSRLQAVGYQVAEDERSIVFVPKLGDVLVFAGVNVMDKSVTTVRPALPDDARLKLVDDAPAK